MARHDLRDAPNTRVLRTIRAGAKALLGADQMVGKGDHYAPTVLAGAGPATRTAVHRH